MAGAGYRTFQSGEVLTSNNVQTYLMDQAVQVYAGTAERGSAVPSPSTGMVAYSTATGLQVFDGSAWVDAGGVGYGVFTGGNSTATGVSIGGETYTVLTFTSDSNLVCTTAGLADVLLVGGGGGSGGGRASRASGGAGGGGVIGLTTLTTMFLEAATYAVDVGAGGSGGATTVLGQTGFDSSIGGTRISVAGGGAGAEAATNHSDMIGASNGGATDGNSAKAKTIAAAQGNLGGSGPVSTSGGGGGGFGSAGGNGASTTGGAGGNGSEINGFTGGV
jgi:hypothetical protein